MKASSERNILVLFVPGAVINDKDVKSTKSSQGVIRYLMEFIFEYSGGGLLVTNFWARESKVLSLSPPKDPHECVDRSDITWSSVIFFRHIVSRENDLVILVPNSFSLVV